MHGAPREPRAELDEPRLGQAERQLRSLEAHHERRRELGRHRDRARPPDLLVHAQADPHGHAREIDAVVCREPEREQRRDHARLVVLGTQPRDTVALDAGTTVPGPLGADRVDVRGQQQLGPRVPSQQEVVRGPLNARAGRGDAQIPGPLDQVVDDRVLLAGERGDLDLPNELVASPSERVHYSPREPQGPVIAAVMPGTWMLTNSHFPSGEKRGPANSACPIPSPAEAPSSGTVGS